MTQANYHAIAVSCAVLIIFIGLVHEVVGPTLYPWAPGWFGPVIWHGMGVTIMILGLVCLATIMGGLHAPLAGIGIVLAVGGLSAVGLMVYREDKFHFVALCNAIAAVVMIWSHRKCTNIQGL
jgi:hypothetical protein